MENVYLLAGLSVLAVSLVSMAGLGVLSVAGSRLKHLLPFLVSIAAGAMLGNAFLHLLPESLGSMSGVLEHFAELFGEHAHEATEHAHGHGHSEASGAALATTALALFGMISFFGIDLWLHKLGHCCEHKVIKPVGWLVLVGDGLENLIDGILIGAAYMVSIPVGIATTVAVLAHEVPVELGDFGVLVHSGFTRRKALLVNFISALAAAVGCLLVLTLGSAVPALVPAVAPIAAGAFVYMAASSLFPVIKEESIHAGIGKHFVCVLSGIAVMALLLLIH